MSPAERLPAEDDVTRKYRLEEAALIPGTPIFGCPECLDPWESEPSCEHFAPDAYDCGHASRQPGCGGCDPSAVEFVRDVGGPWIRVIPPEEADR